MKGFQLFSDIFSIFVLLGVIMLSMLILWAFILLYNVETNLGVATTRTVELTLFFNPVRYDTTLLSLMEYENNGMPIKKILNAVAIQENTVVWLEGNLIDLSSVCENFLSSRIDEPYLLKAVTGTREIIIVQENMPSLPRTPLRVQESSTKLFTLDGTDVELKLWVYVK
ncbi:MAG: hypothetical protein KKF44_07695 [Nanoarchaeota archaeon]|nr:hypothetical protein [Nanoarchaeota archaeon]